MNTDLEIILRDGRTLTWAEFGDPDGWPVFYFHGSPSSRLEPLMVGDDVWRNLGLRIIAADRPGIGGSTFQPRRAFSDWPNDVEELADALGIEKFSVLGNSGGGPYVAVCAAKIPQRVRSAAIVSGGWRMDLPDAKENMPFVNRLFMVLASRVPPLCRLMLKIMGGAELKDRAREIEKLRSRMPEADVDAFAAPGRIEALFATMRECMRNGTHGAARDLRLYMREFDFDLSEIKIPIVMFHGEKDVNSPIQLARRMAAEMPTSRLITFETDAHFSTLCNHVEQIAEMIKDER